MEVSGQPQITTRNQLPATKLTAGQLRRIDKPPNQLLSNEHHTLSDDYFLEAGMRVLQLINAALHEYREFGWPFLKESIRSKFYKSGTISVNAGKYGIITVRRSEDDLQVVRNVLGHREYDVSRLAHVQAALEKAYTAILQVGLVPVIVDAGANIGAASIWFNIVYPEARIVAIEPVPANVEILRANCGKRENISVIEGAIGATPGFVAMSAGPSSVGGQTSRSDGGIKVYTVPEAVSSVNNGKLFIAKIDIEGFEGDLFGDNTDWIDEAKAVVIEPHEWMLPHQRSSHSFQKAFGTRNFDLFIHGENIMYVAN